MNLAQQLSVVAAKNLARPACHYLGKETNYAELKSYVGRLSFLYLNELGPGARVAFAARNSPAVIASFFALSNTRSMSIPIDVDRPPEEIIAWIRDSQATHVAVTSDMVNRMREYLQHARLSLPIVEIEKKQAGEYDPSYTPPPDNIPLDTDIALLVRTGGNGGAPKFVALNHKSLHHATISLRGSYHLQATDRVFTPMSWSHPFAFLHGMLFPLMVGATSVIEHGAEGKELLEWLAAARVTRLVGLPPFFQKLLAICASEKKVPSTLIKSATVGLGSLSPELRKFFSLLKIPVMHCYGQAEAAWTIAMEDSEEPAAGKPGYVGKSLPGVKYKVVDANGDEVTGRETREGLLAVTGPTVMSGYLGLEKETKSAIRGTWLYTGDYVRLENDGEYTRLTFLGRKDDVLNGGEGKILTPDRIDPVLRAIPGVQDGAGFILQTAKGERVLAAAVVKKPGQAPLNDREILEHCKKTLPPEQTPQFVAFTDLIPKDRAGNVHRGRLRAQFSGTAG
jgi:acyl-CoA synthetase (AMP-forming)/AMP-acid ligase II